MDFDSPVCSAGYSHPALHHFKKITPYKDDNLVDHLIFVNFFKERRRAGLEFRVLGFEFGVSRFELREVPDSKGGIPHKRRRF